MHAPGPPSARGRATTAAREPTTDRPGDRPGTGAVTTAVIAVVLAVTGLIAVILRSAPADDRYPPATSAPVRVMPLGDSITASPGCWRALLWRRLQQAGYRGVDFVGTQDDGGGCPGQHDPDHEGHPGFTATGIARREQLVGWAATDPPDVVLMHLGTNDVLGRRTATPALLAAYTRLVTQLRAANPEVRIVVAQIIPIGADRCRDCDTRVTELNRAIPAWADRLGTARSPISVVDQYTGFDPRRDTGDGVHPNRAGEARIADRWYPVLVAAVTGR